MTDTKKGWLSGWKAIAEYCDVTIQTVQKYAKGKGLPVKKVRKRVYSIPEDLDLWLREQKK